MLVISLEEILGIKYFKNNASFLPFIKLLKKTHITSQIIIL